MFIGTLIRRNNMYFYIRVHFSDYTYFVGSNFYRSKYSVLSIKEKPILKINTGISFFITSFILDIISDSS